MRGVSISIEYLSRYNRIETISFRASLQYTVANASTRESIEDIRQKAPQQYYTQNRMVTGEDYNILPYTSFSSIKKVKAINRSSSGLSRYLDVLDTTGKYSSTNTFGEDGVLYADRYTEVLSFSFNSTIDIRRVVRNQVLPDIVAGREMMHYFYANVLEENPMNIELAADELLNGETYTIVNIGDTDFSKLGAEIGQLYETFVARNAEKVTREFSVANVGFSTYVFSGSQVGGNIDIIMKVGDVLKLNVNASGHPLWIKTSRVTGTNFSVNTGIISSNGTDDGTITWDTTGVAPGTYYYICQNHGTMSGYSIVS